MPVKVKVPAENSPWAARVWGTLISMRHLLLSALMLVACHAAPGGTQPGASAPAAPAEAALKPLPLAESDWEAYDFGSSGAITLGDGMMALQHGERLTGNHYTGDVSKLLGPTLDQYEIQFEARFTYGHDIFVGLTFPVGHEPAPGARAVGYGQASLVLGGWGGSTCGLSCTDGADASTNIWKQSRRFEQDRWYAVRLRVDAGAVTVWLDGAELFRVPRDEVKLFALRSEVEPTAPLGFFTYGTSAELRKLAVRCSVLGTC